MRTKKAATGRWTKDWRFGRPMWTSSAIPGGDGGKRLGEKTLTWLPGWVWLWSGACKVLRMPSMTSCTLVRNIMPYIAGRKPSVIISTWNSLIRAICGRLTCRLSRYWSKKPMWKKWCVPISVSRENPVAGANACFIKSCAMNGDLNMWWWAIAVPSVTFSTRACTRRIPMPPRPVLPQ